MSNETKPLQQVEVITSFDMSTILAFIAQKEQLGYKINIGKSNVFFGTVTVQMELDEAITDVESKEVKSETYKPSPVPATEKPAEDNSPAPTPDTKEGVKEAPKQKTQSAAAKAKAEAAAKAKAEKEAATKG